MGILVNGGWDIHVTLIFKTLFLNTLLSRYKYMWFKVT